MFFFNAFIIAALVRILVETDSPLLCAALYALSSTVITLAFSGFVLALLVRIAVAFGLSFVYFWVLNRLATASPAWWLVLVAGLFMGLV